MQLSSAPDLLTVEETAKVLRIGRNKAHDEIRAGRIPAIRLGRTIRVPKAALLRLLETAGTGADARQTEPVPLRRRAVRQ